MNSDPLQAMRNRLRRQRLALTAEVCRYTGIQTRQQLRELLSINRTPWVAKAQSEAEPARLETCKDEFETQKSETNG
jgi:hypothetical protein